MALINYSNLSTNHHNDDIANIVTRCINFAITAYIRMHAKYFNAPCSHRYIEFDVKSNQPVAGELNFAIYIQSIPPSFVERVEYSRDEYEMCLSEVGQSFMSEVSSVAESIVEGFLPSHSAVPCIVSEECWQYHENMSKEGNVSFILDAYRSTSSSARL